MKQEILRLFKGYIGEKSNVVNQEALKYGLLIPETASQEIVKEAIKQYGKDGLLWNQTFHKDFKTVADSDLLTLVVQQIVHYVTTYGFETVGCYNESTVYIPAEKLEVPEVDIEKIKFTVINAYTEDEVKEKLIILVTSGIALSKQSVEDIKAISDFIDKNRFDEVANREVRTFLYDKYHIMPSDPEAFLRYMLYKLTGATLKIQNVATYKALYFCDRSLALNLLKSYPDMARLSSIFLRNKNLFLALKKNYSNVKTPVQKELNNYINRLRKLAVDNHKALKANILDNLTNDKFADVTEEELVKALDKATTFRCVRILNALSYRLSGKEDIIYRVRNGRSYVSKLETYTDQGTERLFNAYKIVYKYVVERLSKKVAGKTVCIPDGFTYKAPTSEKQFLGNVPEGSCYTLPADKNLIIGVHWLNLGPVNDNYGSPNRIDLDLGIMNLDRQFSWCEMWRGDNSKLLFSGDITTAPAPNGATELFYFDKNSSDDSYLITLNDYTRRSVDVPFEIVVAYSDKSVAEPEFNHYVIDPNNIIAKFNAVITPDSHQVTLGMVKFEDGKKTFHFNNFGVGKSGAVATRNAYTIGAFNYFKTYEETQTSLNELLLAAGATVVNTPVIEKEDVTVLSTNEQGLPKVRIDKVSTPVDYDLSSEALDKTTIISLFS